MRLSPRDTTFIDLFATSARLLVEGAELLGQLLGAHPGTEREELAARLVDVEHRGTDTTHEIIRRLNSAFVTPFDREDIYALAVGLDNCVDHMEAVGQLVVLYAVDVLPDGIADQVAILQRQAELTSAAMPRLHAMRDLADYWVEISRLENEAGRAQRRLMAGLFEHEKDVIALLKIREVATELEAAAEAFGRVARTVETVAVKES